jgi:hypothetical protein
LRFYVRLPAEAHAAFRRIEKLGTDQDMDLLTREISRKTLDAEWEVAHRRLVSEMKANDQFGSEDEMLAEAVRLTQ